MSDVRSRLLATDIARALGRKHKPCEQHGRVRVVCRGCARVFCPRCDMECPRCDRPYRRGRPEGTPQPKKKFTGPVIIPRVVKTVWQVVQPMGALRIDPHEDSGGWMAIFPFPLAGIGTAQELSDTMFRQLRHVAQKTPFGTGRMTDPDVWYVTFTLVDEPDESDADGSEASV